MAENRSTHEPGDQVGALGGACEELARDSAPGEVVAQNLCSTRLVARRIHGVHAKELLQERRDLVAVGH